MILMRVNEQYDIVLNESENIGLSMQIADVRDIEKRTASFSKTIKINSNKDLDKYFGFIFDMQSELGQTTFNPAKRTSCKLIENDVVVIDGFMRLLSIDNNINNIVYNVGVYGTTANLFAEMGEDYLDEVVDTLLSPIAPNFATIQNSWVDASSPYYFTPINQNMNRGVSNSFTLQDFKMSWKLKYLFQKVLENYGYTYESTFINFESFLDQLFIYAAPLTRELTQEESDNRKLELTQTITTQYSIIDSNPTSIDSRRTKGVYGRYDGSYGGSGTFIWYYQGNNANPKSQVLTFNDTQDVSNQWVAGKFRPLADGLKYKVNLNINVGSIEASTFGGATFTQIDEYRILLKSKRNGVTTTEQTWKFTSPTIVYETYIYPIVAREYWFEIVFVNNGKPDLVKTNSVIDASVTAHQTDTTITPAWANINVGSKITMQPLAYINPLNTFFPNERLPHIKCKEIVQGMTRLFNLMIDVDKENVRNLIIEPYPTFYNLGSIEWSDKLCRDKEITITPLSEVGTKQYRYKHKTDKDFYQVDYANTFINQYGQADVTIQNDFATGLMVVETPFSLTPPADYQNIGLPLTNLVDEKNAPLTTEIARIGFRQLIATPINVGGTANAYFPAFMDTTTTLSLCFATPKQVYYTGSFAAAYPNNNLFTRFYAPQLAEYADPTSRLLTAYFNIDEMDLHTFNFRKNVIIDNVQYRVNKLDGYAGNGEPTKVELIKVIKASVDSLPPANIEGGALPFDIVDGGLDNVYAAYRYLNVDVFDGMQNTTFTNNTINDITSIDGGRS